MSKQPLNKQQKRMKAIVQNFQKYVATYSDQYEYLAYSDKTFIDDMLYGIGLSIDRPNHDFASGYDRWKDKLREHLGPVHEGLAPK